MVRQRSPSRLSAGGRTFRISGLFSGIGGLELGFHRSGHESLILCEIEDGAAAVLRHRFPDVPVRHDVTKLKSLPKATELVTAGFPCQDLTWSGRTQGIDGSRSRLVHEVFRLLRRRRIPWVLLENVPFMLRLSRGRAMNVIVSAFEELGYKWAYRVVNSQAFGLPQRRERVYLLASTEDDPRTVLFADDAGEPPEGEQSWSVASGFYWTEGIRGLGWAIDAVPTLRGGSTIGIPSPPAIVLPESGLIGMPDIRDGERLQGFRSGWTNPAATIVGPGQKATGHRWKLVGNAVSVDVAEWIGRRLKRPSPRGALVQGAALDEGDPWPRAAWNIGDGRRAAAVSAWPKRKKREPLHEFLRYPLVPLSVKATAGFLGRVKVSGLRFPTGFVDKLEAHLKRMEKTAAVSR